MRAPNSSDAADRNWGRFVLFRVHFNSRFSYPILAVLFLDLGLSATQYTLLNFAWATAIVCTDLPPDVLADWIGRRPLIIGAAAAMVIEMAILCLAPADGGTLLFFLCLANRVLSGVAEGLANGADGGLALHWRWSGVIFSFPLGASMVAIGFVLLYYLNAMVESKRRATVLSL